MYLQQWRIYQQSFLLMKLTHVPTFHDHLINFLTLGNSFGIIKELNGALNLATNEIELSPSKA